MPDTLDLLGPVIYVGIDCHELADGGLRAAIVGMNPAFECALLEQRDGLDWIAAWLREHRGPIRGIAVDVSRLGGLIAQQPGIEGLTAYTAAQMAEAAPALRAALKTRLVTVLQRSEALGRAVKAGRRRFLPGGTRWLWSNPGDADISPLIALTLAHALASTPAPAPWAIWGASPFSDNPGPDEHHRDGFTFYTTHDRDR